MGLFKGKERIPKRQSEQGRIDSAASENNARKRRGPGRLRHEKPWIYRGALISLAFAAVFSSFYGIFRSRAEKYEETPIETADNIAWLYQNCYLLYHDLRNAQSEKELDYRDIYLETGEGHQWILDAERRRTYNNLMSLVTEISMAQQVISEEELIEMSLNEAAAYGLLKEEQIASYVEQGLLDEEVLKEFQDSGESYDLSQNDSYNLENDLEKLETYFGMLEENFPDLNSCYGYIIEDHATGKYVTNMSVEDRNRSAGSLYFRLSFQFDDAGNVTIGDDLCGKDVNQIRKLANEAARMNSVQIQMGLAMNTFSKYGRVKTPAGCTVTYTISSEEWSTRQEKSQGMYVGRMISSYAGDTGVLYYDAAGYHDFFASSYYDSGLTGIVLLCMLGLALLGLLFPMPKSHRPWMDERICTASLEFLVCFGTGLMGVTSLVLNMIAYVASGRAGGAFSDYLRINSGSGRALAMMVNMAVLAVFAFCCWYVGVCARALPELGLGTYIRERSLIYRIFPFIKGKAVGAYDAMAHMDLTRNANKTIIKILIVNAVILALISFFWVGGVAIIIVYSIVLYFILRKYVSELQKRYRILLKAVDEIAAGNLNVSIPEDLGIFEPFREQVFKIQDGLQKAVETEVKSQRMKVELVTNMSHDLKTPLTAIITYINLLKENGTTEEQRKEYLDTLERKSLRLKSLIDDLFEFSKASSQNITLNIMDLDIMNLVKQVAFEMSDKIGAAGLDVRMNLSEEKVILPLDSQKTYRIYENLFGNIAKYALPGTRVYVNGFRIGDTVIITLKNISAREITVDSSELTERFVRGDASRNTEGSGLGLAIAKSFMELQGGELDLEVDGDLFKVTTTWHVTEQESYPEARPNSL